MLNLQLLSQVINERHNRPLVGLKWAQTLDGQLADDSGNSKWISGSEELIYTHELRAQYDAILVGASTFLADLSKLTVRSAPLPSERLQPVRIILDPRNRVLDRWVSQGSEFELTLADGLARPTVILNTLASREHIELVKGEAYFVNIRDSFDADLGLRRAAQFCKAHLGRRLTSIMVEGGPTTLRNFLDRNLADVACVGIAPIFTGGVSNRIQLMKGLSESFRLKRHSIVEKGEDTVIEMISEELRDASY